MPDTSHPKTVPASGSLASTEMDADGVPQAPRPLLSDLAARLASAVSRVSARESRIHESLEEVIEESDRETQDLSPQERTMLANLLRFWRNLDRGRDGASRGHCGRRGEARRSPSWWRCSRSHSTRACPSIARRSTILGHVARQGCAGALPDFRVKHPRSAARGQMRWPQFSLQCRSHKDDLRLSATCSLCRPPCRHWI